MKQFGLCGTDEKTSVQELHPCSFVISMQGHVIICLFNANLLIIPHVVSVVDSLVLSYHLFFVGQTLVLSFFFALSDIM